MSALVSLSAEEATRRSKRLTKDLKTLLATRRELADIALDSLLNAYVQVANETGRLQDCPGILRCWADRIDTLNASRTTH